jgi:tRNA(Ile)-lysidine synthase
MQLLQRIRRYAGEHHLFGSSTRVLAAVSGGPDSVALLHLLVEFHARGELVLVGVCHFNHQLRTSARGDQRFTTELSRTLGLACLSEEADVAARARAAGQSIERAAHDSRHEFFERARRDFAADVVAVGHTRDDQAETVLLRLIRGAGARGLAGMYPRRDTIIRPLLDCRRGELREYLTARGVAFREDESNRDVTIPRNRIRTELLPLLESRFNPAVVDVLADEATLARESWEWMRETADRLWHAASRRRDIDRREWHVDIATLEDAPPAMARMALWRALTTAAGDRAVAFGHVETLLELIRAGHDRQVDLPGVHAQRIGSVLVLTSRPPSTVGRWSPDRHAPAIDGSVRHREPGIWYPLSIPGEVQVHGYGYALSVEAAKHDEVAASGAIVGSGPQAVIRADRCRALAVRNRRPGDRFRPVGALGRKKLQDYFVDRKVARQHRDSVPLVVDELDRIVWVAGYGIDESFRVTDPVQSVLLLRLKPVGGAA